MRSRSLLVCVLSVLVALAAAGPAAAAPGFELGGSFSAPGSDPGQLNDPQHVALRVSTGELFVADRANDRVQIFDSATGTVEGQFGDAGTTDDAFGVAVDQASGDVYVASQASSAITKWSAGGLGYTQDLLFSSPALGTDPAQPQPGEVFNFAAALAVDPASGDLLVADPTHVGDPAVQRVQRYDSSGAYVGSFDGTAAPGGAFQGLRDIATDAGGDVYAVDGGDGGRVLRFDGDGTPDAAIPVYGRVSGPGRVAVDPTGGDIAVAVNVDDSCGLDRVVSFDAASPRSETVVPPSVGDCTIPTGLAFDAAGGLLVATGDVCGAGAPCGGATAINRFTLTGTSATVSVDPATGVGDTAATLSGTLNPEGAPATYWFETSTDGIGYSPVTVKGPIDGGSDVTVSQTLSGLSEATHYWVRLAAKRGSIIVRSAAQQFTTIDVNPPDLTVEPAGAATESGAMLHATVDSNGSVTSYHFEYSGDGGGSWVSLSDELDLGNVLDQPTSVAYPVSGLAVNHSYLTRVVATNAGGTSQADGSFDTLPLTPTVDTPVAADVTDTSARLTGIVNPRNSETVFHFEYGPDTGYGTSTPAVTLPADMTGRTVVTAVDGLQPGTGYHFKLVADNGTGGPQETADQTFTTTDLPAAAVGAVSDVTPTTATVSGSVDTRGLAGSYGFSVVQTDGTHSQASPEMQLPAAAGTRQVTASVRGLPADGQFEVRLFASTAGGQRTSAPLGFSTPPKPAFVPGPRPPAGEGEWFAGLAPVPAEPGQPSNAFTARAKVGHSTATLTVSIPGPGVVRAAGGSRLATVVKRPRAKGKVALRLRLTKAGRKALSHAKSHTLRVRVTITFTPTGGEPATVTRTLTFDRKGRR